MKPGDTVQVRQNDLAIEVKGEEPKPMTFWIYATVLQVLDDGAMVEIAHQANREHGVQKKVLRADLRTIEDVQAAHDAHPLAKAESLIYDRVDAETGAKHNDLINLRAARERLTPQKKEEAA